MYVIKRDGKRAPVQFDKITARISKLCYGLSDKVQSVVVAQKVRCRRWQPSPLRLQASNALAPSRVPSADRARPAHQVCAGVYPDVTTAELDDLAAETAAYLSTGARAALPPPRPPPRRPARAHRQTGSGHPPSCAPRNAPVRDSLLRAVGWTARRLPGVLAPRGAHLRLEPAQAHEEVVPRDHARLLRVHQPQEHDQEPDHQRPR